MFTMGMVFIGMLIRLLPHLPNFTPISATAIFGGTYLNKKLAILIPLVAMAISDYLLLYINPFGDPNIDFSHVYPVTAMFHATTLYVWTSVAISGLIGIWIRKHKKPKLIVVGSLIASIQFFVITNFGVWMAGYYGNGISGLIESYIAGLPFFKYTIFGDLFYTVTFFGIYELSQRVDLRRALVR